MHVFYVSQIESKIAILGNIKYLQTPRTCLVLFLLWGFRSHMKFLPYLAHQLSTGQDQVNVVYQRPKNYPSPYFDPNLRNYSNFYWHIEVNIILA